MLILITHTTSLAAWVNKERVLLLLRPWYGVRQIIYMVNSNSNSNKTDSSQGFK